MIVVATYQEAENICRLVEELLGHLPDAEVRILDDQSPDGTARLVTESFGHLPNVAVISRTGGRGYGAAMRDGMALFLASGLDRLVTIDADLSHDPALTVRMLERVDPGGMVIGSRYVDGVRAMNWSEGRLVASLLGNRYVRKVTGLPVADCTSGFRCYTRAALERLDFTRIRAKGYAFLVEVLYWVWRSGAPVAEVPIVYRDRCFGESKLDGRILAESLVLPWRLVLWPRKALRRRPTSAS